MHFAGWELWIAAALLLAGAETLHGALVLLAMAVACLPPALGSALGMGPAAQVLLFAGSLLAEFPLIGRFVQARRVRRLAGNAEAIVGKRVRVLQPVTEQTEGVVLLTGEHWKARSLAGELQPGAEAQVVQRDGLLLLVVPFER
jgi:membrane protein implicated in regulation of membrane protease activity